MTGGKFEKVDGTEFEMAADLVLLAMGFVGPEREGLLTISASRSPTAETWPATRSSPPRCPGYSSPATWAAGSR